MENATYTTLTRLSGLSREMDIIANNIANAATTGFRSEEMIFSEYVQGIEAGPSISMAQGNIRWVEYTQGTLTPTGGRLDFAIEGDGFFLVQTPQGERLTRAGSFATSNAGDLVTHDGYPVLDAGGAPLFIPPPPRSAWAGTARSPPTVSRWANWVSSAPWPPTGCSVKAARCSAQTRASTRSRRRACCRASWRRRTSIRSRRWRV